MELSIDTASDLASLALSREGEVAHERSWHCRRNHTVELLPAIDAMLAEAGIGKGDLTAVFVSIGPGMYTGLRVGVSIGKGLARALRSADGGYRAIGAGCVPGIASSTATSWRCIGPGEGISRGVCIGKGLGGR